jgi:hypothetical protein
MLVDQIHCGGTFIRTHYVGISCHIHRIELVPESSRETIKDTCGRVLQRLYHSAYIKFVLCAAFCFLILVFGGGKDEGEISDAAKQVRYIQDTLLRAVGRREGPMGCNE